MGRFAPHGRSTHEVALDPPRPSALESLRELAAISPVNWRVEEARAFFDEFEATGGANRHEADRLHNRLMSA